MGTSSQHPDFHHTRDGCQVRAYFKACWKGTFPPLTREAWGEPSWDQRSLWQSRALRR